MPLSPVLAVGHLQLQPSSEELEGNVGNGLMELGAGTTHGLESKVLELTLECQFSDVTVSVLELTGNVTSNLEQKKILCCELKLEGTSVDFSPCAVECCQHCSDGVF